jgi:hypothetical protein
MSPKNEHSNARRRGCIGEKQLICSLLLVLGLLLGGLLVPLLDTFDHFELLLGQLHELLVVEIPVVQGGKEGLRGGKRRDGVGGLGDSGSGLQLLLGKLILDHGTQVLELVSKMELLDELGVWLRLRLLHDPLLLVPVGELDPLGGGNHLLLVRQDVEVQEEKVRGKVQHLLDLHEAGMNLWRQGSKG